MKIYLILHHFIPLNIIQTAWNVTSLQEADKSRTGLCDSVMKSKLTSIMKNPFAENFLSREKRTFDNSIILHSFRWKCFIQRLNVNAVKESRKNMQILLSLISIIGGKPASATYVSWKGCETWLSSKKSSYFRLKSKRYLLNNQELAPFSLDNLKMFFHTVRGFFNSHYISQLL